MSAGKPDATALLRCVCGADVPLVDGGSLTCAACGREHMRPGEDGASSETIVLPTTSRPAVEPTAREGERRSLVGRVVDHFEVLEELGRGGMGTVYRALDRSLERYVALKVLDSQMAQEQRELVEAFIHEARTQARMNHPGIATIYFIGRFDGMTYFAMEVISGIDLEARVKSGRLRFAEVVGLGLQVVEALREAQSTGVIHRDIKPGNIILSRSGRVKITDFGLAKTEQGGLQITGARRITGTPYYISPEQARGEKTDFRSDIYSLGATLYHLAYGHPPFEGDGFLAVISKHLGDPVRFPESPPRDIPAGFPVLIERMMAKKPEDRFSSYEELEAALLGLRPEALHVAAFGRRAVAAGLDLTAFTMVLGSFLGLTTTLLQGSRLLQPVNMALQAIVVAVALGEQAFLGTSLGKIFGKLRIARIDGRGLERWRLAARAAFQFLPFVAALAYELGAMCGWTGSEDPTWFLAVSGLWLADHLWALTNPRRRTIHDLILGTWVLDQYPGGQPRARLRAPPGPGAGSRPAPRDEESRR